MVSAVPVIVVPGVVGAISEPMRTISTVAGAVSIVVVARVIRAVSVILRENGERDEHRGGAHHERDFELHNAGPVRVKNS